MKSSTQKYNSVEEAVYRAHKLDEKVKYLEKKYKKNIEYETQIYFLDEGAELVIKMK